MNKLNFTILFCLMFISVHPQKIKLIDFSDRYSGELTIISDSNDNQEENATLLIYDNKLKKTVLETHAFVSEYDLEDKKVKTNVLEFPYGEQSILIYDDFNFDGIDDIAVRVGYYSCYGGPAYNVYLAHKNTFDFDEDFTDLAQSYCGFFITDSEKKQISTMTKSGCCWHQYNTYKVENNKPVLIESIEESYGTLGFLVDYTHSKLENGKMITKKYHTLPYDANGPIFELTFKNGKRMVLYEFIDNELFYGFLNSDGIIELYHNKDFVFNSNTNELIFKNGTITYEISDSGINVIMPTKTVKLNAIDKPKNKLNANLFDNMRNVSK
ncbi:XAC2610-related protein [Flavobacterium sp. I3-2]|uniref:XAC2610-related protein n=1 Tax=Flavobacterium sp. I3-2 TaxID=2748319 RepID=UPI0015ADC3AE|nr:FG-GAP repeat protein [Flavobacterium sp. I3-2]